MLVLQTIRWFAYLFFLLFMQIITFVITPVLPSFAQVREGRVNNNNDTAYEPRLPKALSWFDTPDNSLWGDDTWRNKHSEGDYWTYFGMTKWLYRNSLYGLKSKVLSVKINRDSLVINGNTAISRNKPGVFGSFTAYMNGYWQYKVIKPIFNTGYCYMLNMGWLLDDSTADEALFLFSPRICLIK